MREVKKRQLQLGEISISQIKIDVKSRDDIPQLLLGLQYIYVTPYVRREAFEVLERMIPEGVARDNGRPGMELWKILVLGTLRLNLNCDYDRVQELANQHKTIRQMLGHGMRDSAYQYNLQTLKDNVGLFTYEILNEINEVVVRAGHSLVKKNGEVLIGRCDSFVVETDVHFPTDINLLFDASRKVVELTAGLCEKHQLSGWRQSTHNLKQIKKRYRKVQKAKHSTSRDELKRQEQKKKVRKAHRSYVETVSFQLSRARQSLLELKEQGVPAYELAGVERFLVHADRQIDQIKRRVFEDEVIPHPEKVFSVFQEHTEWISKGKAGVPVELGLRVCVLEDQHQFILHHQVMEKQTDDQVTVGMVKEAQKRFPQLRICSFDKGFHSPSNQDFLRELLDFPVLPRKGRLSKQAREIEYSTWFIEARQQHSAVESGINALEVHGLDRCPDHGIEGFKRYVALAVLSRNIQRLGAVLRQKQLRSCQLSQRRKKAA